MQLSMSAAAKYVSKPECQAKKEDLVRRDTNLTVHGPVRSTGLVCDSENLPHNAWCYKIMH